MAPTGPRDLRRAQRCFRALGDETRLRLVALLRGGEQCVCDLTDALGTRAVPALLPSEGAQGRRHRDRSPAGALDLLRAESGGRRRGRAVRRGAEAGSGPDLTPP